MAYDNEQLDHAKWINNINFYLDPAFTRQVNGKVDDDLALRIVNETAGDGYTDVLMLELRYRDCVYLPDGVIDRAMRRECNTHNTIPKYTNKYELPRHTLSIIEWIANLHKLGYTIRFEDAFNTFGYITDDHDRKNFVNINEYMEYIYNILRLSLGMNYVYIPFFKEFSKKELEDDCELYVKAICHYAFGTDENFNEKDFYTEEGDLKINLNLEEDVEMTFDEMTAIMADADIDNYKILEVVTNPHNLDEVMVNMLSSNTTWSKQMRFDFVRYLNTVYRAMHNKTSGADWFVDWYDVPKIANKENLAFVAIELLKGGYSSKLLKNSINNGRDVLRIYAEYSGADSSLSTPPKFKNNLNGSERRYFMDLCMEVPHLFVDASRDSEMWKRAFERIHPERYGKQYDRVKKVADDIRHGNYAKTPNSAIEDVVSHGADSLEQFKAGLKFFEKFPSQFIRYFDSYVRHYGDSLGDDIRENSEFKFLVTSRLYEIVRSVESTKMLYQLWAYYGRKIQISSDNGVYTRFIQLKGARNYTAIPTVGQNLCNPKYLIDFYEEIFSVIYTELVSRFHKLPWLGNVYIDPIASRCTVPVNLRNASSTGLNILGEGSIFMMEPDERGDVEFDTLYMPYIHWTNYTNKKGDEIIVDLDLSVSFYGENFNRISHTSFRNLRSYYRDNAKQRGKDYDPSVENYAYSVHSGDITDGGPPDGNGVSESIIISRTGARMAGARYAIIDIHSYRMINFSDANCFFGFQAKNDHTRLKEDQTADEVLQNALYMQRHFPSEIDPKHTIFTSYISCESTSVALVLIDFEMNYAMWMDRDLFGERMQGYTKEDVDTANEKWDNLFGNANDKKSDETKQLAKEYVSHIGGNTIDHTVIDEITQFKAALEKPKLFCGDLLDIHTAARGVQVQKPELANLIFTLPGTKVAANAREDQTILTPYMVDRWINEFLPIESDN